MREESEAAETGCEDELRRTKRRATLILAAFAAAFILFLVVLWESQRSPFGFSVGQPLPPGKVVPQLVRARDLGVLLAPDGSLWCWGGKGLGKTGLVEEPREILQRIGSAADWCRVAAAYSHAMALKTDGSLWAWGWNGSGASTQGHSRERVTEPTRIGTDTNWTQIAVGAGHCLALRSDGSLYAWGQNDRGQVGDGSTNDQFTVTQIGPDHEWRAITAGDFSSFALKKDGTLWGWGCLVGNNDLSPQQIDAGSNVVAISACDYCLLALRANGTLWICGQNAHVTASAHLKAPTRTLVQVGKDRDWKEVYAGQRFFFARKRNGSWWVCGCIKGAPPSDVLVFSGEIAPPRRLPLSFDPWSLAPGFGNAFLLAKDGSLWTLSIGPNTSRYAVRLTRVKLLVNQLLDSVPGHAQLFDTKRFSLNPKLKKLWELPDEASNAARIKRP